jgi:hypothetical protein
MTLEEIDTIDDKNGLILDMSKQNEKLMQDPMVRIANALEEILRLVKADQEKYTAREAREMLQDE